METLDNRQPFWAISKICLNNWHYIDRKILTLSEGINFFTGHSGSGKSTVIDAIQIVLYANTDGRGFFNKAAADDSDRTLIEYLRGMVNISENNESQYLRNKNFSSTIVIELEQTRTHEKQCVGVVFDVETATNEINRLFFWHRSGLLANAYRGEKRCLSTVEIREYLQRTFGEEAFYCGPSNERFRRQLYDVYLGGLDKEKFPRLFKRAIPFRMNIKLEEFVKEYICMEQDIQIEDLKESIMQYGRMRSKIESTMEEIEELKKIDGIYQDFDDKREKSRECDYHLTRLEMLRLQADIQGLHDKIKTREEGIKVQEHTKAELMRQSGELQKEHEELLLRLNNSGYKALEAELAGLNETLEHLGKSRASLTKTAQRLAAWKEQEITSNQTIWDIDKFEAGTISEGELTRLKENIAQMRAEIEEERRDTDSTLRQIKKEEREAKEELKELKQGRKAYPKELEEARLELQNRLQENCGKFVSVQILADLLEIRDERWHNAVEGYMGNNKLLLIVEPKYAKAAMDIYQEMDKKKFFRAAILDTEKVMEEEHIVRQGALAEEVKAKEKYVQSYINFFLGNVMKCENIEELRECRIGVTPDCMLYHSYRLQHINPENYTRRAYIGEISLCQRIRQLQKHCDELQEKRLPLAALVEEAKKLLELEAMPLPTEDYISQILDAKAIKGKETRKKDLLEKLQKLRVESVDTLEAQMKEVQERRDAKQKEITKTEKEIWKNGEEIEKFRNSITESEFALSGIQKEFQENERFEKQFEEYLEAQKSRNYIYLKEASARQLQQLGKKKEEIYQELVAARSAYTKKYTQRNFSVVEEDNKVYQELLESLSCDNLETYRQAANEQAKAAVEHFKDDFVFKIRSAIREAYQRRDELNRIISRLDFGKDKYQFVITKNKGADGKYYKMFMDDTLQINPAQLSGSIENQMNLFTMEHEENYGDMMNELIGIFIPPENATHEELEEAKKNMDKYADYRTYLSFDMQQIVQGEEDMKIGLGKMIRKNSGGEGQNPLYVALLASFAQIYRINLSPKIHRNPTLRLVVLDEAFSKMDAEKVASCIALIRGLGFQAIISATNDKIQNYLENVDKTFVYANPNKRHISIQEFEKTEFAQLADEEEQG